MDKDTNFSALPNTGVHKSRITLNRYEKKKVRNTTKKEDKQLFCTVHLFQRKRHDLQIHKQKILRSYTVTEFADEILQNLLDEFLKCSGIKINRSIKLYSLSISKIIFITSATHNFILIAG